eukprot:Gb_00940 [translate_table: standard]
MGGNSVMFLIDNIGGNPGNPTCHELSLSQLRISLGQSDSHESKALHPYVAGETFLLAPTLMDFIATLPISSRDTTRIPPRIIQQRPIGRLYSPDDILQHVIGIVCVISMFQGSAAGSSANVIPGARKRAGSSVLSLFNLKGKSKFWSETIMRGGKIINITRISEQIQYDPKGLFKVRLAEGNTRGPSSVEIYKTYGAVLSIQVAEFPDSIGLIGSLNVQNWQEQYKVSTG